jgi:hypothetical protein
MRIIDINISVHLPAIKRQAQERRFIEQCKKEKDRNLKKLAQDYLKVFGKYHEV